MLINKLSQNLEPFILILLVYDTTIFISEENYLKRIENCAIAAQKIIHWIDCNYLTLNMDKTITLCFSGRHKIADRMSRIPIKNNDIISLTHKENIHRETPNSGCFIR